MTGAAENDKVGLQERILIDCNTMNALTDKFVNVSYKDGKKSCLSIYELLQDCDLIEYIDHRFIERVSIIRLLICIVQASLKGPKTKNELKNLSKKQTIDITLEYIKRYFNFFDEKNFLQVAVFQGINKDDLNDFDIYKKAENTPISFENHIEDNKKQNLFLKILVYQNFSHGGLIGNSLTKTKWGTKEDNGVGLSGVCYNKLISYLSANSLWETLCLNMITLEDFKDIDWGKPAWECDIGDGNGADIKSLSSSYLGRLVPISKIIKINGNSSMIMRGIKYYGAEEGAFDQMMWAYLDTKKNVNRFMHADFEKHPWRSLHLVDQRVYRNIYNASGAITVISGAMIYDQAKPIDEVEWEMQVEKEIVDNAFSQYKAGVDYAEDICYYLEKEMKNYDDEVKYALSDKKSSKISYWSSLNKNNYKLIKEISINGGFEEWKKIVNKSAMYCFDNYIPKTRACEVKAYVKCKRRLISKIAKADKGGGKK